MKRKYLYSLFSMTIISLSTFGVSSCESTGKNGIKEVELTTVECGKYGTIYEIFPYSYADSDGDKIGDLNGIRKKLDYIHDLGFTGIWITPIQPSPTYHGYDTTDYYDIRPEYGTLDDYKALVDYAHRLNMTVYMDLVINHTSTQHPWFIESANAHLNNNPSNQYYDYYLWNQNGGTNYRNYGNGWYYEHYQYDSEMASFNLGHALDYPNGKVAKELENLFSFWLVDYGVDGFRLDAIEHYFSTKERTTEFLTWLVKTCRSYKPDCYIVAEGSWGSESNHSAYLESGIDSFFCFSSSQTGYITNALNNENARLLSAGNNNNLRVFDNVNNFPSPFIANHDTGRLLGYARAHNNPEYLNFAYATLQMYTGSTYHYYGDEIGMRVMNSASDPEKRTAMYWSNSEMCINPPGAGTYDKDEAYPYGSVNKLQRQNGSTLNFIKKTNQIRNSFPSIFRGYIEEIDESSDRKFSANVKWDGLTGENILILMNASKTEEYTCNYTSYVGENNQGFSQVVGQLCAINGTYIKQMDKNVKEVVLPPLSYCLISQ